MSSLLISSTVDPTLVRYYKLKLGESQVMNYIWVESLNTCGSDASRVNIPTNLAFWGLFFSRATPLVIGFRLLGVLGKIMISWKNINLRSDGSRALDLEAADIISS